MGMKGEEEGRQEGREAGRQGEREGQGEGPRRTSSPNSQMKARAWVQSPKAAH